MPMRREIPKDGTQIQVERVNNASGSTAGAGSGDFHQYRIQRRRERARVIQMEKEHEMVYIFFLNELILYLASNSR